MKMKMSIITMLMSILFYLGVVAVVYLYFIDDNSYRWMIAFMLIIVGIIGYAIPEAIINVGADGISSVELRIGVGIKYVIFAITYIFLDKAYNETVVIILILCVISIILDIILWRRIEKTEITTYEFLNLAEKIDLSVLEKNKKYIYIYMIGPLLFHSFHDFFVGVIVTGLGSCVLHLCMSEKIIKAIPEFSDNKRKKARIYMWLMHFLVLLISYLDYNILVYFYLGTYYAMVTDWMVGRKTTLVKL